MWANVSGDQAVMCQVQVPAANIAMMSGLHWRQYQVRGCAARHYAYKRLDMFNNLYYHGQCSTSFLCNNKLYFIFQLLFPCYAH